MQKNDIIELVIEDVTVDGEGIGKFEGMAFFVKDAIVGDKIKACVTKLKKTYGYARVLEILEPSVDRAEPRCSLHKRCGGCQIQAMDYRAQLVFKEKKVRNNMIRLGGFSEAEIDAVMEPIVGMEEPFRYRNKAQFPVGIDKEGNLVAGFYAARSHDIIPVTDCQLGVTQNQEILEAVLAYMRECKVKPYDEKTGKGLVRHVLIRYGFTTKEIMVCLIINGKSLPQQEKLIGKLSTIEGMQSISINVNTKNTNVILGDETMCIWGSPYITDYIHLRDCKDNAFAVTDTAIAYHISPQSFYQVNPVQTEKLYSLALDYAGLTGKESVWDLYCGIGTISLFLAGQAGKVYGVEIVPQAIEDAKNNAKLNGIENAEFFVGKAEEVLPEFYEKADAEDMLHPDVIVVDPPRKGCDEKCLETMLKMQPERIVYVSCDSATLARDVRILCDGGYELKRLRACDQFAQTTHVETIVLLSGKNKETVNFDIDVPSLGIRTSERATYSEIKQYIKEKYNLNVSNLYIAQVKEKCGIDMRENFNLPKSEDSRQPKCPKEKEKAILEALKHFGLVK